MDITIKELLQKKAEQYKDKDFIIITEKDEHLSYAQLADITMRIGSKFLNLNARKGDRIAIFLPNCKEFVLSYFGSMVIGCIAAPVNLRLKPEEIKYILTNMEPRIIIASSDKIRQISQIYNKEVSFLDLDSLDQVENGDICDPGAVEVRADDEALLIYTSGTISRPKGILLTQQNLISSCANTVISHLLSEDDRALCILPLYHLNAETTSILSPLYSGGSVVLPPRFSASEFWQLIATYKVTWFSAVPAIYSILLCNEGSGENYERFGQEALQSLKFGRSASSSLPVAVQTDFENRFKLPIIETMGISEASGQVFANPMPPLKRKFGSVGLPQNVEIKIVDENAQLVKEGEILVKGPTVMKRYFKNDEATAEALQDGWLFTGDTGYRDEEGYHFIAGRKKEIINRGGEKISPRKIDEVLYLHSHVKEAATVGVADPIYSEEVKSFVVLKGENNCTEDELIEFCKEKLADFECPKSIEFVNEIPKSHIGKLQRCRLAESSQQDFRKDTRIKNQFTAKGLRVILIFRIRSIISALFSFIKIKTEGLSVKFKYELAGKKPLERSLLDPFHLTIRLVFFMELVSAKFYFKQRILTACDALRISCSRNFIENKNRFLKYLEEKSLSLKFLENIANWNLDGISITGKSGKKYKLRRTADINDKIIKAFRKNSDMKIICIYIEQDGDDIGYATMEADGFDTIRFHLNIYRPADRNQGIIGRLYELLGAAIPEGAKVYKIIGGSLTDARNVLERYWRYVEKKCKNDKKNQIKDILYKISAIENTYGSAGRKLNADYFPQSHWKNGCPPAIYETKEKVLINMTVAEIVRTQGLTVESEMIKRLIHTKLLGKLGLQLKNIRCNRYEAQLYGIKGKESEFSIARLVSLAISNNGR